MHTSISAQPHWNTQAKPQPRPITIHYRHTCNGALSPEEKRRMSEFRLWVIVRNWRGAFWLVRWGNWKWVCCVAVLFGCYVCVCACACGGVCWEMQVVGRNIRSMDFLMFNECVDGKCIWAILTLKKCFCEGLILPFFSLAITSVYLVGSNKPYSLTRLPWSLW